MKATFIHIIGKKVFGIIGSERIELFRYGLDADEEKIQSIWENFWDSVKEDIGLKGLIFSPVYNTPSGEKEPGCIYWADWYPEKMYWDNHEGPHLIAVLPNGRAWNIDSRASNCTMPEDRTHRCWCRHGIPPNITVDKNGNTCSAGAGSIQMDDWHGFLRNGEFIQC